jgi:hypothetical protein
MVTKENYRIKEVNPLDIARLDASSESATALPRRSSPTSAFSSGPKKNVTLETKKSI